MATSIDRHGAKPSGILGTWRLTGDKPSWVQDVAGPKSDAIFMAFGVFGAMASFDHDVCENIMGKDLNTLNTR